MEVLNAAGFVAPLLSLHKKKPAEPKQQQRRLLLLPRLAAFTSAFAAGGLAKALTYEEVLGLSPSGAGSGGSSLDLDLGGFFNGVASFAAENPLVVGGGALALAVPLILSQLLNKPKNFGVQSARSAFEKLVEDASAQLLDIREGRDLKEVGSPDLRSLKKKAAAITFRREDKPGFLKKLELKFKDPANTALFILDKFDGNSELVAELATVNGFKAAYAIKDGAEGPRGWMKSGLPWSAPKGAATLNFDVLKDAVTGALGGNSEGLPVTLGLAAATGLGVLAFTEIETVLQLLGSAAIIQVVAKKLLFADDRKATLQQVDEFLNTKVAPKELVDEIKIIGKALLPSTSSTKASLPAPVENTPETSTLSASDESPNPVFEAKTEILQATKEPPAEVNSVPKAEVKEDSIPGFPRPLSPYPYYSDLKPPSSPSPSAPYSNYTTLRFVQVESSSCQAVLLITVAGLFSHNVSFNF